MTYEDKPSSCGLDLHLEECKSTFNLDQILTVATYIDLRRQTKQVVLSWIYIQKNANPLSIWFKSLQMLLTLTYVDITSSFGLDLHSEECKSTFILVQILTVATYIDL